MNCDHRRGCSQLAVTGQGGSTENELLPTLAFFSLSISLSLFSLSLSPSHFLSLSQLLSCLIDNNQVGKVTGWLSPQGWTSLVPDREEKGAKRMLRGSRKYPAWCIITHHSQRGDDNIISDLIQMICKIALILWHSFLLGDGIYTHLKVDTM